jgi:hypothetical protein
MTPYYLSWRSGRCFSSVRLTRSPVNAFLLLMHRLLDELLAVFVVFRTPLLEAATLKAYLGRLVVNVEAFAFSTAPPPEQDPKAGSPKELIYSGTIKPTDEPSVVSHGEGDEAHTFIIWKVDIFVGEIYKLSDVHSV